MNRLAVVSTPRSGNTWFRVLLAQLYDLVQCAVQTPDALNRETLQENYIVQLHWHRLLPVTTILAKKNFRVVTISHHPLDFLISILQFSLHEPQTASWLDGENVDETAIHNKSVISSAFLSYAVSSRATALLSVSREWGEAPVLMQVRYEELAKDTNTIWLVISMSYEYLLIAAPNSWKYTLSPNSDRPIQIGTSGKGNRVYGEFCCHRTLRKRLQRHRQTHFPSLDMNAILIHCSSVQRLNDGGFPLFSRPLASP
jgi:hypothetical protein